jgi:hypothetical protein
MAEDLISIERLTQEIAEVFEWLPRSVRNLHRSIKVQAPDVVQCVFTPPAGRLQPIRTAAVSEYSVHTLICADRLNFTKPG